MMVNPIYERVKYSLVLSVVVFASAVRLGAQDATPKAPVITLKAVTDQGQRALCGLLAN